MLSVKIWERLFERVSYGGIGLCRSFHYNGLRNTEWNKLIGFFSLVQFLLPYLAKFISTTKSRPSFYTMIAIVLAWIVFSHPRSPPPINQLEMGLAR